MQREVFAAIWAKLEARFNTERPTSVFEFYLDELSERLSDEEIREGIRSVMYSNRFFPSPKEIVDAVKGDDETEALDEWTELRAMVEGRTERDIKRLNEEARRALESIGGMRQLSQANLDDLRFYRRDFLEAYRAYRSKRMPDPGRALPAGEDPAANTNMALAD